VFIDAWAVKTDPVINRGRGTQWLATLLAVTVVGLSACSHTEEAPFNAYAPDVRAARSKAVWTVQNSVLTAVRGLPIYASTDLDACEQGQDNPWVQDDYRIRCVAGYKALAGVRADSGEDAVRTVERHLRQVSCTGGGLRTDSGGLAGLDHTNDDPLGPQATVHCPPGEVYLFLVRTDDAAILNASQLYGGARGPVSPHEPIDVSAAMRSATADGLAYMLVADYSVEFFKVPR
jgi:hypothetical protein